MTKISDLDRRWSKDADYKEAYDALGEECDLARALIEARTAAGLSQSRLAPANEDLAVLHRAHRGRQGTGIHRRSRALRACDPHAPADHVRTAGFAVANKRLSRVEKPCGVRRQYSPVRWT
jgi:hypothetical protein